MPCWPQKSSISCVSGEAADHGAGKLTPLRNQAERGHRQRLLGRADQHQSAVALQQVEIGVDVVLGGNGIEDEVEAAGVLLPSAPRPWRCTTSCAPRRLASSVLPATW